MPHHDKFDYCGWVFTRNGHVVTVNCSAEENEGYVGVFTTEEGSLRFMEDAHSLINTDPSDTTIHNFIATNGEFKEVF